MDITPEYIKMCEKAKEIQGLFHACHTYGSFLWDGVVIYIGSYRIAPDVCLFRQDQLQEIWREEYLKRPSKHGWFGEFCNFMSEPYSDGANADESFDTMEQIWLAFVMKEKGKVWNGGEWVAIESSGITG